MANAVAGAAAGLGLVLNYNKTKGRVCFNCKYRGGIMAASPISSTFCGVLRGVGLPLRRWWLFMLPL